MQIHIFSEASKITAEESDQQFRHYYGGLFDQVTGLYEMLAELRYIHFRVLSKDYGIAYDEEKTSAVFAGERKPVRSVGMAEQARTELYDAAGESDVIVIFTLINIFQKIVEEVWDELIEATKPESIWFLGAVRSLVKGFDFQELVAKDCTVLTYQRVGVARIGTNREKKRMKP